jgi:hypothetical protein
MKRDEERTRDWQEGVWLIKEGLSAEAKKMGMRKYLAYVEKEADRILEIRTKAPLFLARDKPPTKPRRPRSRSRQRPA